MTIHDRRKREKMTKIFKDKETGKTKIEVPDWDRGPYIMGLEDCAPNKKNAPDAPDEREEVTVDGGEIEVTVTATELQIVHAKLDRLDSKIEFLLKYLEL